MAGGRLVGGALVHVDTDLEYLQRAANVGVALVEFVWQLWLEFPNSSFSPMVPATKLGEGERLHPLHHGPACPSCPKTSGLLAIPPNRCATTRQAAGNGGIWQQATEEFPQPLSVMLLRCHIQY
eukprot:1331084-Amphidinium_carterae.1